jgi:O-methyltransferase involved in polyketide biosynthesis
MPKMPELEGVSATLLLALAARALAPIDTPDLHFRDPLAERILREMCIDPRRYKLRKLEVRSVVLRAQWFADRQREFFRRHPNALAINFGCGLTASYEQVADTGDARFHWYDLDLEPVIGVRRRYFAETMRRRMLIRDASRDPFYRIPWVPERPALIVAEGLLYYLRPAEVAAFLQTAVREAAARQSHVEILFDYASAMGARFLERRPAHRQLGTRYDWTMRRSREITAMEPRLEIVEDANLFALAMDPLSLTLNMIHRLIAGGNLGGCMHLRLRA